MGKNALLLIDIQNDFCPGGALAVDKGDEIIDSVNALTEKLKNTFFYKIIATQDWHPKNHCSFASTYNKKPYEEYSKNNDEKVVLWPDHCIEGSYGADFTKNLITRNVDLILHKGTMKDLDSYSAFVENDHKTHTGLHGYLSSLKITSVYIVGLAFDYCVYYSAIDAVDLGYYVTVIEDATRSVNVPNGSEKSAYDSMIKKGIAISYATSLLNNNSQS